MKNKFKKHTIIALTALSGSVVAMQAATLDTPLAPSLGGDNGTQNWTISTGGPVELALRAKVRYPSGANDTGDYDGNGNYTFNVATDYAANYASATASDAALWNFDFVVNTGDAHLDSYDYRITIGLTSGAESFDFINPVDAGHDGGFDHFLGETFVVNESDYENIYGDYHVAQNSWNIGFFEELDGSVPNGDYTVTLEAFQKGTEVSVDSVSINVSQIPEPTSSMLGLLGAVALMFRRRAR